MALTAAVSLQLEIKFWPEMNAKEKRDTNSKSKHKQTNRQTSQKLWQHRNGANILVKVIRLTEVTGRHLNKYTFTICDYIKNTCIKKIFITITITL